MQYTHSEVLSFGAVLAEWLIRSTWRTSDPSPLIAKRRRRGSRYPGDAFLGDTEHTMSMIIALALFAAVVGAIGLVERSVAAPAVEVQDGPKRAPRPGARDRHAVTGMLGRASVPSWG